MQQDRPPITGPFTVRDYWTACEGPGTERWHGVDPVLRNYGIYDGHDPDLQQIVDYFTEKKCKCKSSPPTGDELPWIMIQKATMQRNMDAKIFKTISGKFDVRIPAIGNQTSEIMNTVDAAIQRVSQHLFPKTTVDALSAMHQRLIILENYNE